MEIQRKEATMAEPAIHDSLIREISTMTEKEQQRALSLIRGEAPDLPRGATWEDLRHLAGTLDKESAQEMREAIEEGCEQVDPNAW
jgi:hypothetical protein